MDIFIARQPILDKQSKTYAYELLYRDGKANAFNPNTDGNIASMSVISDAITEFGLEKITGKTLAFINFTRDLILKDYAYFFKPQDVIVEILEDVAVDALLIAKVKKLYDDGYTIALDDFVGTDAYNAIMSYVKIIKVDFMLTNFSQRKAIADEYKHKNILLLAEKVQTREEHEQALAMGYVLFQGYYFAKPSIHTRKKVELSSNSYMSVIAQLNIQEPDFDDVASTIKADVNLTYKLFRLVNSAYFYRGVEINSVKNAVVMLGLKEIKKWITLIMIRDISQSKPDELVRTTLVRARFAEKLSSIMGQKEAKDDAFFVGMFSLIDVIVDNDLEEVLKELPISERVKTALLTKKTLLAQILALVEAYENGKWTAVATLSKTLDIDQSKIANAYTDALDYAQTVFD